MRSAILITRLLASFAARCLASALMVVAAAMILCTCSPGADYPTPFPAVNNMPPPRSDTPLDANQVQQATEDLISARDRLSAGAQGTQGKNSNNPPVKAAAKSATKSPVNSRAAAPDGNPATAPASVRKQPGTPVSAQQTVGTDADQTAGTETK